MNKLKIGIGILACALGLGYLGLDQWADARLQALQLAALTELQVERARVAEQHRPAPRGSPVEGNAAERYDEILATVHNWYLPHQQLMGLMDVADYPAKPLPPALRRLMERAQPVLADLRAATLFSTCDWQHDYGLQSGGPQPPSLRDLRLLGLLLVLDGQTKAAAGRSEEAASAYLAALRFASDAADGPSAWGATGVAIAHRALQALGDLAVGTSWNAETSLSLLQQLGRLESVLPSLARSLRSERIETGVYPRGVLERGGLLARLDVAYYMPILWAGLQRLEGLSERADRATLEQAWAQVAEQVRGSSVLLHSVPSFQYSGGNYRLLQARYELVRSALGLEQRWASSSGLYPLDPRKVDLPADPLGSGTPLRYAPAEDGLGYSLWSAGPDGKDDGGDAVKDLMLRRHSATTREALARP